MKKDYRTDLRRLVSFFESSRDKWKRRSHTYQAEKRALQTQVRDLKRSVEHWKSKYKELEHSVSKKKICDQEVSQ
jgi:predicted RNase H-like nuclease (RuvC/YqgF family)